MIGLLVLGIILLCAALITIPSIIFMPPLLFDTKWFDTFHTVTLLLGGIAAGLLLISGGIMTGFNALSLGNSSETDASTDGNSENSKKQ